MLNIIFLVRVFHWYRLIVKNGISYYFYLCVLFKLQYQTLKPQYEQEIKAALTSHDDKRMHTNEDPRESENIKQPFFGRGENRIRGK